MNQQLLPCPETSLLSGNSSQLLPKAPLSFVLTEFHALLLYVDHVKGMSILNQELIFEDMYNDVCICLYFYYFLIFFLMKKIVLGFWEIN